MTIGTTLMARPKKGAPKRTTEKAPDERVAIIHLKGTADYAKWLDDVHRRTHIPKATIFRLALAEWAAKNGHPVPPEL